MDGKRETSRHARRTGEAVAREHAHGAAEAAEDGGAAFAEAAERGRHQVSRLIEEGSERLRGGLDAAAAVASGFGGGTALSRSSGEFARGLQDVGQLWTEMAQDMLRDGVAATQTLLRCRTLGDVIGMQSALLRGRLESFIDRSARLAEISTRLFVGVTQAAGEVGAERSRAAGAARR